MIQLEEVNRAVNDLGYRADVTDVWNAYDISLPNFNIDDLPSFDCDDATLTKRATLAKLGVDIAGLRPALCKIPSARYGGVTCDHMVLLAFTETGTMVLDNIIPWVYPFKDAPYEWVAMLSTTNGLWRLIGWRWPPFTPNKETEDDDTS
jgi:predicted transglutaminase-like cysteine proteinase